MVGPEVGVAVAGGVGMVMLFVVGVAAMIGLLVWGYLSNKKRQEAITAWVAARDWRRLPPDRSLAYRWRGEPFNNSGDNERIDEVVAGAHLGWRLASFAYSYETHSTNSKGERDTTTHSFHVIALDLPAALPDLQVSPESVFSRIATAFGAHDLDVESDAFNKSYNVRASDLAVGHAILHPRLIERLLREPGRQAWRIEGATLLSWTPGRTDVAALDHRIALLAAIADSVPRHIWLDHGHDPITR